VRRTVFSVGGEEALVDEAGDGGHGLGDGVAAKPAAKRGQLDAGVHAQAEEPGLFKLAGGREPGGFGGGGAGEDCALRSSVTEERRM
jgi:hypothetical protein